MSQKDDPTIERIREARHRISEAHNHDPQKVVEYYIELQKKYERRIVENSEEVSDETVKA